MPIGFHTSIAGGIDRSVTRAAETGCDAMQIFCHSPRMWKVKFPTDEVIARFRAQREEAGLWPVVVHTSYLINLSTPDDELYKRSRALFNFELELCERLGVDYMVTHPGSHQGRGIEFAGARIIEAFREAREKAGTDHVRILIENTAGGGTQTGRELTDLRGIIRSAPELEIGLCFDTCHGFAKGYSFTGSADSSGADSKKTSKEAETSSLPATIDRELGLEHLKLIHLNDSKGGAGSKIDRHEHIGKGLIGKESLRAFINHPKIIDIPLILETPENEEGTDKTNLKTVKSMLTAQTKTAETKSKQAEQSKQAGQSKKRIK
ncbi:Endonuclease IV [hydrothermal vent metagenome]|uniref:Endonuclease IV n=1 Tax=hydrothermal vent metagenome TaxID=652676 RepID=A0A3B0V1C6_9ZZZZ